MKLQKVAAQNGRRILRKAVAVCFWISLVVFCFINKDEITVESIVNFTPENPTLTALIMLALFALKSLTFFIYGGILYAANDILFPLPVAILMNIVGTIFMTTLPFLLGKKAGAKALGQFRQKISVLKIHRLLDFKYIWQQSNLKNRLLYTVILTIV